MPILDLILDGIGLLLWMSWRMAIASPAEVPWHGTLLRTLRRASPTTWLHWGYPIILVLLLLLRGVFYHLVGPALHWVPHLDFGVVTIPCRSDWQGRMMMYSFLSFGQWLGAAYLWFLLLSVLTARVPEGNAFRHFVQVNLGWLERLPAVLKLLLPVVVVALVWSGLRWWFAQLGLMPPPGAPAHVIAQGGVLGVESLLAWQYLLVAILLLFLLHSYFYIGTSPFWIFIEGAGMALLAPVRRFRLRLGKFDFAPVVALALVFIAAHHGEPMLELLFRRLSR